MVDFPISDCPAISVGREDFQDVGTRSRARLRCQTERRLQSACAGARSLSCCAGHQVSGGQGSAAQRSRVWSGVIHRLCSVSTIRRSLRHGAEKVDQVRKSSLARRALRMQMLTVLLRLRQSCCDLRLIDAKLKWRRGLADVSAKLARLAGAAGRSAAWWSPGVGV